MCPFYGNHDIIELIYLWNVVVGNMVVWVIYGTYNYGLVLYVAANVKVWQVMLSQSCYGCVGC